MWLPVELPLDLQQAGVPIEAIDGELAWSANAARAVVEALRNTTVAIVSGEILRAEPVGLVPTYNGWAVERNVGETASEYAARSRQIALERIGAESASETGREFYALRFSSQQDAA
jgi:hypothetical protein